MKGKRKDATAGREVKEKKSEDQSLLLWTWQEAELDEFIL